MIFKVPKWFSLLAAFVVNGHVWGSLYSYSVMYSYLKDQAPQHEMHISLIGSLLFGITMGGSLLLAPLMQRIAIRQIYVVAILVYCLGPFASAFVTDIRLWYITYTIPVGLGGSGICILSYVTAALCYPTRLCFASTVVSVGTSVFTILVPFMVQNLLANFGLQYSMLIVAGYMLCSLFFTPGYLNQTTAHDVKELSNKVEFSMQLGSAASLSQMSNVIIQPTASLMKIICTRDFLVWLFASVLQFSFNNVAYVHLTSYAKHLISYSSTTPMYFMITLGAGATISKIFYAIIIEKYKFSIFLAVQSTFVIFSISLSLLGLLDYFTNETVILLGIYCATFLLGFGEGPIWSLAYPATYETCKLHTDPTIYCIYCGVICAPYCLGGPIGTALYQYTRSYSLVYFVAALGYLSAANILWASSQTHYSNRKDQHNRNIELDIIEIKCSFNEETAENATKLLSEKI